MKNSKIMNSLLGIFTIILLCGLIEAAPVSADDIRFKWHRMDTPGSVALKNDLVSPCEVNKIAIGADGKTFYAVDIAWADTATGRKALYKSVDGGISWHDEIGTYLYNSMLPAEKARFCIWNVAIANDNPNYVAVVTNNEIVRMPRNVWFSIDGGTTWANTQLKSMDNISAIAVSPAVGKSYIIAAATRTGAGNGSISTTASAETFNWRNQGLNGDVLAISFSPGYLNDNIISIVFSDEDGTYLSTGVHDIPGNAIDWLSIYHPGRIVLTSANAAQIISADLELPPGFHGQMPAMRKYFVSIDAPGSSAGVYRVDNTEVVQIMAATPEKRISDISFHGDIEKGKLLAGEVLGNRCSATVKTWFTTTPFICGVPCWFHAEKPATGGAGNGTTPTKCANATTAWSKDGSIAYVATGTTDNLTGGPGWALPYLIGSIRDESAFSISRNNGRTWNQIALIDTAIDNLVDIAPSPDGSTIYLASNNADSGCAGFDSVWISKDFTGHARWERVLCARSTSGNCTSIQSDTAILRMAGDKPHGDCLIWAAQGTGLLKWTSDSGDDWASIGLDFNVQDAAFEDAGTLYILAPEGTVHQYRNSGNGWRRRVSSISDVSPAYSINTAFTGLTPDNDKGVVIVGGAGSGLYDVAYSYDEGVNFTSISRTIPARGNTMVMASSGFRSDGYILAINSTGMYACSLFTGQNVWEEWWGGPDWPDPVTGLAITRNYSFYFATAGTWGSATPYVRYSAATAGFDPSISLGSPDLPTTRFRASGGMELNQPVTVYAIDQRHFSAAAGGVWYYTDDLLWSGPSPTSPVSYFKVTCDPVSGRAGTIELKWLPRSLSKGYAIHIAKDIDFTLIVAKIGDDYFGPFYKPFDLDRPSLYIPPGGGMVTDANGNQWTVPALEAGNTYYWKVRVQDVATGDYIRSPWSWRESFSVMPGYPVRTPYLGTQLLSPINGCMTCPLKPAFSWSDYQGVDSYEFQLAADPEMKDILYSLTTKNSACSCNQELKQGRNYFWRVRAISNNGEPMSDYSAVFCFQTAVDDNESYNIYKSPAELNWVWAVIGFLLSMIIATLVLLIRLK